MRRIRNVFLMKEEVSTHEATKRALSLPLRWLNISVVYIATALKKKIRIRMLKLQSILEMMHPDDPNAYSTKFSINMKIGLII